LRQTRPVVAELDELVEEFITAVQEEFPNCCIQFEDWARADAFRLLARYRERICCFNDDIQGSGAAVLAGIRNALFIAGGKLTGQTFVFLGAGATGVGIAELLTQAMSWTGSRPSRRERASGYSTATGSSNPRAATLPTCNCHTLITTRQSGTSSPPSSRSGRPSL
jgi:hypothetical protein